MIREEKLYFMKHGDYISDSCWQLLHHSASILLCKSHSWYPLLSLYYFLSKPYKSEMYILHCMEIFSILGIFVCFFHNMFQGFLYVYDINYEFPVTFLWQVFAILDLTFSPISMLILFFIVNPIYSKVKCKMISFYHTLRRGYGKTFWKSNYISKSNNFQIIFLIRNQI